MPVTMSGPARHADLVPRRTRRCVSFACRPTMGLIATCATVHILAAFPAGGTTNIAARLIAQALSGRLGRQFIGENRPVLPARLSMTVSRLSGRLHPGFAPIAAIGGPRGAFVSGKQTSAHLRFMESPNE